jgi:hypothetical protein
MSVQVTKLVWDGSRQKSGNLLVLLAISDHAANDGTAYPGIRLLARKVRLSERHVRRCIQELLRTGELKILAIRAPGGGPWYQIQLDHLSNGDQSHVSSRVSPASIVSDAGDNTYIKEPPDKPSVQSPTHITLKAKCLDSEIKPQLRDTSSIKLVSPTKNGF